MATKIILQGGMAVSVYDDRFLPIYEALGVTEINRATNIEFNHDLRQWTAIELCSGRLIAVGKNRNDVTKSEISYLERGLV